MLVIHLWLRRNFAPRTFIKNNIKTNWKNIIVNTSLEQRKKL